MSLATRNRLRRLLIRRRPARTPPERLGSFVFVGGLHRSGTTLLARYLANVPTVATFKDTGFPQDEGEHIQSVLPSNRDLGGPGRFAFHPNAHIGESSTYTAPETRDRILREWAPYLDLSKPHIVEKSPSNLLRTRFLSHLFPGSKFVLIVRHPIAVTMATRKWCDATIPELLFHWQLAHEKMLQDLTHDLPAQIIRYEDLVREPTKVLTQVLAHTCLDGPAPTVRPRDDVNDRYFQKWGDISIEMNELIDALSFEQTFSRFGYSLNSKHYVKPWTEELLDIASPRVQPGAGVRLQG